MRGRSLPGLRTARQSSLLFSTGNDIFWAGVLEVPKRLLNIEDMGLRVELRGVSSNARVLEMVDNDESVYSVRITDGK